MWIQGNLDCLRMIDGRSRDLDARGVRLPRLDELDVLALGVASVTVHGRLPARSSAPTSVKVTEKLSRVFERTVVIVLLPP